MQQQRPNQIIEKLRACGYEAYFVGGCVRDILLGRQVHDWDITTSALPEQVMQCFEDCAPTGISHGTVTVRFCNTEAEVTTYRSDGNYRDGRHPEQVTFVKTLAEDLKRRDFTINALAMDVEGKVIDLHGGLWDLQLRYVRCIGDPAVRFREDALRMLRAVRFAAQLGFQIEKQTELGIRMCSELSRELSTERMKDEMEKILCSSHPEYLDHMASLGLIERCNPSKDVSCKWLSEISPKAVIRWAGLCKTWTGLDLRQMRLDKKTTSEAMVAAKCIIPKDRLGWKKLAAECGIVCCKNVAELVGNTAEVNEILSSGECVSMRQLAVKGTDFPGISGPELGERMNKLLLHVLEHPEDNKKEILLSFS